MRLIVSAVTSALTMSLYINEAPPHYVSGALADSFYLKLTDLEHVPSEAHICRSMEGPWCGFIGVRPMGFVENDTHIAIGHPISFAFNGIDVGSVLQNDGMKHFLPLHQGAGVNLTSSISNILDRFGYPSYQQFPDKFKIKIDYPPEFFIPNLQPVFGRLTFQKIPLFSSSVPPTFSEGLPAHRIATWDGNWQIGTMKRIPSNKMTTSKFDRHFNGNSASLPDDVKVGAFSKSYISSIRFSGPVVISGLYIAPLSRKNRNKNDDSLHSIHITSYLTGRIQWSVEVTPSRLDQYGWTDIIESSTAAPLVRVDEVVFTTSGCELKIYRRGEICEKGPPGILVGGIDISALYMQGVSTDTMSNLAANELVSDNTRDDLNETDNTNNLWREWSKLRNPNKAERGRLANPSLFVESSNDDNDDYVKVVSEQSENLKGTNNDFDASIQFVPTEKLPSRLGVYLSVIPPPAERKVKYNAPVHHSYGQREAKVATDIPKSVTATRRPSFLSRGVQQNSGPSLPSSPALTSYPPRVGGTQSNSANSHLTDLIYLKFADADEAYSPKAQRWSATVHPQSASNSLTLRNEIFKWQNARSALNSYVSPPPSSMVEQVVLLLPLEAPIISLADFMSLKYPTSRPSPQRASTISEHSSQFTGGTPWRLKNAPGPMSLVAMLGVGEGTLYEGSSMMLDQLIDMSSLTVDKMTQLGIADLLSVFLGDDNLKGTASMKTKIPLVPYTTKTSSRSEEGKTIVHSHVISPNNSYRMLILAMENVIKRFIFVQKTKYRGKYVKESTPFINSFRQDNKNVTTAFVEPYIYDETILKLKAQLTAFSDAFLQSQNTMKQNEKNGKLNSSEIFSNLVVSSSILQIINDWTLRIQESDLLSVNRTAADQVVHDLKVRNRIGRAVTHSNSDRKIDWSLFSFYKKYHEPSPPPNISAFASNKEKSSSIGVSHQKSEYQGQKSLKKGFLDAFQGGDLKIIKIENAHDTLAAHAKDFWDELKDKSNLNEEDIMSALISVLLPSETEDEKKN